MSKGNCGHFSVLPQKTADKHIYADRSYEWNDDKKLLTVKADGLYGHLGFSLLLYGRYGGINEKGSEIYTVHLPASGLRTICNYDFEYYDCNFEANSENSFISFYIPIE